MLPIANADLPQIAPASGIPPRLDELTAARGFAAIFVVLYHVDSYSHGALVGWFAPIAYGPLAVDFFFVLSGFVMAHVYRAAWQAGTYHHAGFILKRFARLWPLHFATLVGVAILVLAGARFGVVPPWDPTVDSFLLNASMLHATGLAAELAWNQPSWSVSAEWFAYLAFPGFLVAADYLRSNTARVIAAVALFAACAVFSATVIGEDLMTMTTHFGVLRIIPSFFAGVLLRCALDGIVGKTWARNPTIMNALLLLTTGLIVVAAYHGASNPLFWPLIVAAILFLALRAAQTEPGVLRARQFVWLGDISYALYLVHAPVLMVVYALAAKLSVAQSPAGFMVIGFVGLAAALVTAHIAHVLIERPAQRWIVGIGRRDLRAIA